MTRTAEQSATAQTYIAPQVVALTGCTYRQLDFWCRSGYLRGDEDAPGSGNRRLFTEQEVDTVYAVVSLLAVGFTVTAAFEIARAVVSEDRYRVHVGAIYALEVSVRNTASDEVAKPEVPNSEEPPA